MPSQLPSREIDDDVVAVDPPQPPKQTKSIQWTEPMLEMLLETLVDQVRQGKRADSGLKAEAYAAALPKVQARMAPGNCRGGTSSLTRDKLRAKVSSLKKLYTAYLKLLDESGFGRDALTGLIIADDEVWDRYLKARLAIAH